jgi:hypothetical protein
MDDVRRAGRARDRRLSRRPEPEPQARVSAIGDASEGRSPDQGLRTAASPLGTEGTAWDVAWALEYLVSDRARWISA